MGCLLTAAECFRKHVVTADLPGLKAGKDGWWSTGTAGRCARFHVGNRVHITYANLGKCPESETYRWLTGQGIPAGCLKQPKDMLALRGPARFPAKMALADAILDVAFGDGTTTERLIRCVVLAIDGEIPEGVTIEVLANQLRLNRHAFGYLAVNREHDTANGASWSRRQTPRRGWRRRAPCLRWKPSGLGAGISFGRLVRRRSCAASRLYVSDSGHEVGVGDMHPGAPTWNRSGAPWCPVGQRITNHHPVPTQ